MTQASDIYNAFVTRMGVLFPAHARLTNPYDLTQNNEQFLRKGWGLLFGPAENTERSVSRILTVRREISVHLTRQVYARELDPVGKADSEKSLLEDLQILIDDLEKNFTLETGSYIVKYVSDTGLTPVHTEKDLYLSVTAQVTAEYQRNL